MTVMDRHSISKQTPALKQTTTTTTITHQSGQPSNQAHQQSQQPHHHHQLPQLPQSPSAAVDTSSRYHTQATGGGGGCAVEDRRSSLTSSSSNPKEQARKGSIGYTVTPVVSGAINLPNTSNLSLSSTSSNSSNSKQSSKNATHSKNSSPPTSRRQSGNSITIKVTNEHNADFELNQYNDERDGEQQLNDECTANDANNNNNEAQEEEYYDDKDRDDGEDTTSNSLSNEPHSTSSRTNQRLSQKKKPKEKKKFVRSAAQQQHHLVYQESEDLVEPPVTPHHHRRLPEPMTNNMNSAFDELFAAAEKGNSSMSAIIEAKMAAEAASLNKDEPPASPTTREASTHDEQKKSSNSRHGSFRSRPRVFSRLMPHHDGAIDSNLVDDEKENERTAKLSNHLGSPQQLTRSCSCKRPGSFKKMRSKNASPNQNIQVISPGEANLITNKSGDSPIITPGGQRRGTQGSITLMDDFDPKRQQQNRAGSLPFENLIRPQTLAIPGQTVELDQEQEGTSPEVYRVRQFVTSKGAIINRGDSFKRSFKRSNQSLSSNGKKEQASSEKKETPTTNNHLNLPDQSYYAMQTNKTSSSSINETSFNNNNGDSVSGSFAIRVENNNTDGSTPASTTRRVDSAVVKTYVVYVLGASTVGKNALIKQFKTSEYRGTYDICPHQSADEEPEEGVSILLDGIESRLQFISMDIDLIKPSSLFEITKDSDAFIVVYSISDKSSFSTAIELLKSIRSTESKVKPVILVGNKSDLVRKRSINREDGGTLALKYGSKFVETSVAINDKVDELLAGILKQIRLSEALDKDLIMNPNEQQTSFIENKKHLRNYSDAQLHDLIKKIPPTPAANLKNSNNLLSFKSNTLSRRFFKPKNKEIAGAFTTDSIERPSTQQRTKGMSNPNTAINAANINNNAHTISFFHKIYNSIFKKKSNTTQLQSVENLFTLPITLSRGKKN